MRFAKLTMVAGERHEGGEDDQPTTAVEVTQPMMLNLEQVKSFYPRKPSQFSGAAREGTRINYANGGGIAVTESFEAVAALFTQH